MKNISKENKITAVAIIAIIALVWVLYQGQVVVPQNKIDAQIAQDAREAKAKEETAQKNKATYDACMLTAYKNYSLDWDSSCEIAGKAENCNLSGSTPAQLELRYRKEQDICLSVFKSQ